MSWKTVRLELAKTPDYPHGSPVRAYLLRLPLDSQGAISAITYAAMPDRATVRRFWPNEPDRMGQICHGPQGWSFLFRQAGHSRDQIFHLKALSIALGAAVQVMDSEGQWLPFKVLRCD